MVEIGDRVQIDEAVSNYYGRCGIVVHDDICRTYPYRVKFDDGDDCIFKGKDLIVLSTEKFKVGDKVKVKDSWFGHDGQVGVVLDIDNYEPYNYNIKFDTEGDNERRDENFMGDSLELVTEEEETSMKFKVGDRVRIVVSCMNNNGKEGVISEVDGSSIPYHVTLDDGGTEWEHPDNITKLEEKVMKFKVGDKVKVKDSWFGFTGEVGLIVRIDGPAKYPYRVKFDVVDEEDEELFAEGSLELVKEKQSFTKSDLKTGMGVVLRNGSRAHVLLGTDDGDVIRFLENGGKWGMLNDLDEQLYDKVGNQLDIVEVYSTTYSNLYMTNRVFDENLVFKREEPKPEPTKMTMKEINEHFGKAIEIIE